MPCCLGATRVLVLGYEYSGTLVPDTLGCGGAWPTSAGESDGGKAFKGTGYYDSVVLLIASV